LKGFETHAREAVEIIKYKQKRATMTLRACSYGEKLSRLARKHFDKFTLTGEIWPCPRADGAKRRARVLIPPGYLHPGKRKH
jgi:hypothetical protein